MLILGFIGLFAYLVIAYILGKFIIGATYKPSMTTKVVLLFMALTWPLIPVYILIFRKRMQ